MPSILFLGASNIASSSAAMAKSSFLEPTATIFALLKFAIKLFTNLSDFILNLDNADMYNDVAGLIILGLFIYDAWTLVRLDSSKTKAPKSKRSTKKTKPEPTAYEANTIKLRLLCYVLVLCSLILSSLCRG